METSRLKWLLAKVARTVAVVLALAVPMLASADTIVKGRVQDRTTDSGVVGASLSLRYGANELATAITDEDGYFELSFPFEVVREQRTLTLSAMHGDYAPASLRVVVTSGAPDRGSYELAAMPLDVANCRRQQPHLVMVGFFAAPPNGPDVRDLPYTLMAGLSTNLLPELQKRALPQDFQPVFEACPMARPTSTNYLPNFARALGADVFLSGNVLETGSTYKVLTYVGDRYGVFNPPRQVVNENVAVANPAATKLDTETYAYMLIALARGYAEQKKYAECVEISVAAEQLVGAANADITKQRDLCQQHTANSGLVR